VDKRITTLLATVIISGWAISFLTDIFVKTYDPPATIHALIMLLAGAAFGGTLRKNRTGDPE
jgi:hypothetical protein